MTDGFKVSKDLALPIEAARWTNAALAIKGAGKTYGSADFAEELVSHHIPIIVIEPLGIWWGLKVGVNDKGEPDPKFLGLPVVVFGGSHQDLPLPFTTETRGKQSWQKIDEVKLTLMVKSILESGINAILDTSGLSVALQRRIVGLFVFELMRLYEKDASTYGPRHIFLEEVDRFCLSADTEILTRQGWRKYFQIQVGDDALCLDTRSGELRYEPIQRLIVRQHSGQLNRLKTRTGLDCLITDDHRNLIQPYDHGKYERWHWKDFEYRSISTCPRSGFRIPAAGIFKGYSSALKRLGLAPFVGVEDNFIRLLGWIMTDGYWNESAKKSVCISQSKPAGIVKIRAALQGSHFKYTESSRKKLRQHDMIDGHTVKSRMLETRFYIAREDSHKIKEILGEDLHHIPRELLQLETSKLRCLYEGLIGGDGSVEHYLTRKSRQPRVRTSNLCVYKTKLADDFQELCVKLGIRSNRSGNYVRLSERYPFHYVDSRSISKVDYDGVVWDITVPSGNFVARRNGAVFITGNCPQRVSGDLTLPTGAIEQLVSMGGNYNLGCTLISQRPAKVNKNILTQCNCLMLWRILHKLDKDAVKTWVESIADPKDPRVLKWYDTLRELKNGEAWIWHPDADNPQYNIWKRIKFRKRRTLHATREYFTLVAKAPIKPVDVTEYVEKFRKVFEPKPKVETKVIPEHLIKTPLGITTVPRTTITTVPIEPSIALRHGETMEIKGTGGEMTFTHQVPNVTLLKERPTIQVPSEPSSPIGKVLVVLMNNKLNDWRWTGKKIKNLIRAHEWPEDGADEAIAELTRMELLVKQSNNYLHFNRNRVHVVEHEAIREAT